MATEATIARKTSAPRSAPGRRRGRALRGVAVFLAVAALLTVAAPWLAARQPLRGWLLALTVRATGLRGSLEVERASLGWFSPLRLSEVVWRDEQGELIVQAAEVSTSRTLAGLIWNHAKLGTMRIERPVLRLAYVEDGSNLEHALAGLFAYEDTQPSASGITCRIEVQDGEVHISDQPTRRRWKLSELRAEVVVEPSTTPLRVDVAAKQELGGRRVPCRLRFNALTPPPGSSSPAGDATSDRWELSLHRLPLAPLAPLLRRSLAGAELQGELNATLQAAWDAVTPSEVRSDTAATEGTSPVKLARSNGSTPGGPTLPTSRGSVKGTLTVSNLMLTAPALGPDALRLNRAEMPIDVKWDDRQLHLRRLAANCDVGTFSLAARLPPPEHWLAAATAEALVSLATQARGTCQLEIDVARLAAIAPHTLHIQQQSELVGGRLRASLIAAGSAEQPNWKAALEMARLEAVHRGRRVVWDAPLAMQLHAGRQGDAWHIETLECHSEFLQLAGSGSLDDFAATGNFDLAPLVEQLGQIVNLTGWQLEGAGQARLVCKRLSDGAVDVRAEFSLQNAAFQAPGLTAWREPAFKAAARATATLHGSSLRQLERAALSVSAGEDRLSIKLLHPLAQPLEATGWPLELELAGDARRWLDRAQPLWGSEPPLRCQGRVELHLRGKFGIEQGRLDEGTLAGEGLQVAAWGLRAQEQRATLTAAGSWSVAERRIELPEAVLRGSTVSGTVRGLKLAWPAEKSIEAGGEFDVAADLGRLSGWLADSGLVSEMRASGRARLTGRLQSSGTAAEIELRGRIDGLEVASSGSPLWREPRVDLACNAAYTPDEDRLNIAKLAVDGSTLGLDASGAVVDLTTMPVLEAQGTYVYDARAWAALLASYVRSPVVLEDDQPRSFAVRMPCTADGPSSWLAAVQANAALGWQHGRLYGFAFGPTQAQAQLAQGVLRIEPFEVEVNQGRVQLAPELRLAESPMLLVHGRGRVVEQVRVTPEMCREWLRYVAPVLSETTEAEGTFSVDLEGLRMPLDRPGALEAAGRVTLHSVQAAPTPLAQELGLLVLRVADLFRIDLPGRRSADDLAVLWSRPARLRLKRDSQVNFRVASGYVYHENVVLEFQDFMVKTRGAVGFDQSLSLVAEVPIRDEWLRSERLREAFAGKTLQLPVGGTLSRPKLDLRSLERLASDFLREAAADALQGELNRQLDRLLRPRR